MGSFLDQADRIQKETTVSKVFFSLIVMISFSLHTRVNLIGDDSPCLFFLVDDYVNNMHQFKMALSVFFLSLQ